MKSDSGVQTVFEILKEGQKSMLQCGEVSGFGRAKMQCCIDALIDKELIVATSRKGIVEYRVRLDRMHVERVADWNPLTSRGGRHYSDLYLANHPRIGEVPWSISQQGPEAMREWLNGNSGRKVA